MFSANHVSRAATLVAIMTAAGMPAAVEAQTYTPPSGLKLWLDATKISGTNGQKIGTWNDSSGTGLNFLQTTASLQPTYVASAINGQPALLFTGTLGTHFNSGTGSTSWRPTITGSGMTIFSVTAWGGGGQSVQGWFGQGRDRVAFGITTRTTISPTNSFWAWTPNEASAFSAGVNTLNTAWNVQTYSLDSPNEINWNMYLNGTQTGSASFTANVPEDYTTALPLRLGWTGDNLTNPTSTASEFYDGSIAEVMIFDRVLSQSDLEDVTVYLGSKYGIVVVPEPGSLALAAAACMVALAAGRGWLRRRGKQLG